MLRKVESEWKVGAFKKKIRMTVILTLGGSKGESYKVLYYGTYYLKKEKIQHNPAGFQELVQEINVLRKYLKLSLQLPTLGL